MDERDHPLGASPRRPIDQLDPLAHQLLEHRREIVDDVTDVMERRLRMLGDELGDTTHLVADRLDQFDPPLCVAEEDHSDVLVWKIADPIGAQTERVAEEWQCVFDPWYRDRDMMQRA